jgi:hypothetical protein
MQRHAFLAAELRLPGARKRSAANPLRKLHWGQQNDLDSDQVQRMFPALPEWRHQLRVIAGSETAAKTFENDYCRQRGLTL